jgi:hypothetical protein
MLIFGTWAGLPDGLFSYQKSLFGSIWEGIGIGNVGMFYNHLEYFTAILYNYWPFGIRSFWSFDIFFILVCFDQEKYVWQLWAWDKFSNNLHACRSTHFMQMISTNQPFAVIKIINCFFFSTSFGGEASLCTQSAQTQIFNDFRSSLNLKNGANPRKL